MFSKKVFFENIKKISVSNGEQTDRDSYHDRLLLVCEYVRELEWNDLKGITL